MNQTSTDGEGNSGGAQTFSDSNMWLAKFIRLRHVHYKAESSTPEIKTKLKKR